MAIKALLVPDARNFLRWHSVRANVVGAVLSSAAAALALAAGSTAGWIGVVPVWAVFVLFSVISVAALIGRLLRQPALHGDGA